MTQFSYLALVKLGWKKQSHKINPGGISNPIITGENDPGENDPSGDCVWDIILGDIDFIIISIHTDTSPQSRISVVAV